MRRRWIPLAVVIAVAALLALVATGVVPLGGLVNGATPAILTLVACPAAIILPMLVLCFRAGLAADRITGPRPIGARARAFVRFLLPVSNVLAVLAALVGLGLGFLLATIGNALTCFDSCPTSVDFFARLAPGTFALMSPCLALEGLAFVTLIAYHISLSEPRRILAPALVLALGDLLGVAALTAQYWQGQSSLPVTPEGLLVEGPVTAWGFTWGMVVLIVAAAPPAGFAIIQWLRWIRV